MSCANLGPVVHKHLVSSSETIAYEWFTDWLPAATMVRMQLLMKSKATSSIFQIQGAMQTAVIRADDPSAPEPVGSTHSNAGEWCGAPNDMLTALEGVSLVRFGIAYKLTTSGLGQADVAVQLCYESCGRVLGSQTLALATNSTTNSYVPVTGWVPRMSAEVVRAVAVCRAEGNFRWKLAYRLAETSIEDPGGWNPLEDDYHTTGEDITDDLTPTFDLEMWVQFGLMYSTSDATQTSATVSISVTGKKA